MSRTLEFQANVIVGGGQPRPSAGFHYQIALSSRQHQGDSVVLTAHEADLAYLVQAYVDRPTSILSMWLCIRINVYDMYTFDTILCLCIHAERPARSCLAADDCSPTDLHIECAAFQQ